MSQRPQLRANFTDFARLSLALLPVLWLVRVYELVVVQRTHALPEGLAGVLLRGAWSDLLFTLWVAAVLTVPLLLLGRGAPRIARVTHRVLLLLLTIVAVALAQYFAITFVPLGADLFGYSWSDIVETTRSSTGIGFTTIIPFAAFAAVSWFATAAALRVRAPTALPRAFGAAMIVAAVLGPWISLSSSGFASDQAYSLAENKSAFFAERSLSLLVDRWRLARRMPKGGFPLMRAVRYDDVLGPWLNPVAAKPNFVFLIVDGLGRDFVGDGARLGGFTPFVDSLTKQSLYWENFLSTSGRTFGVLPSLLGSLPFGRTGFMELRSRMPAHQSLVSMLGERGYASNYFTGTDGHFDWIDVFLERQEIGRLVDQSRFTPAYERQPSGEGRFSWGYPDDALFRRANELLGPSTDKPRLDIYLTITSHEPFLPPRATVYRERFDKRLAALGPSAEARAEYVRYRGVFETLLYVDDAIRTFIAGYAARADFARTIFVITGDHRLIPIPPASRIDRFRVPFLIYSPLVKAPHRFSSVSSHLDVAPSLLAYLQHHHGLILPDSAHWLGTGIDTATNFRSVHSLALMRTKNTLEEYLDGTTFISRDDAYTIDSRLALTKGTPTAARDAAREKLVQFRAVNEFVTAGPHLYPEHGARRFDPVQMAREDSAFHALRLEKRTPDAAFEVARQHAVDKDYEGARLVAFKLLRDLPGFHDARALLGRTYSWERRFDEARVILEDLVRRAPEYPDGHVALIDVERWSDHGAKALERAREAATLFPRNPDILVDPVRVLRMAGDCSAATAVLNVLANIAPNNAEAAELRKHNAR